MSWVKTEKSNYQNIANAIRSKSGSADTFLPSEMAGAIGELTDITKTTLIKNTLQNYTNSSGSDETKTFTINSTGSQVGTQNKFYIVSANILKQGAATHGYFVGFFKRDGDVLTQLNYTGGTYIQQSVTGSMAIIENGVSLTLNIPIPANTGIYSAINILAVE